MKVEQKPINLDNGAGNTNAVVQTINGKNPLVLWYQDGEEVECAHLNDLSPEDRKKVLSVLQ